MGGQAEAITRLRSFHWFTVMSSSLEPSIPLDIPLLLHADAEQCWLQCEVIPVLRDLEGAEELPEEDVGPALAYLEAMWDEATVRARKTDAAHNNLCRHSDELGKLACPATRYHTAVRALRAIVARRVTSFVEPVLELNPPKTAVSVASLHVGEPHQDALSQP
jgi:hypothetical protein